MPAARPLYIRSSPASAADDADNDIYNLVTISAESDFLGVEHGSGDAGAEGALKIRIRWADSSGDFVDDATGTVDVTLVELQTTVDADGTEQTHAVDGETLTGVTERDSNLFFSIRATGAYSLKFTNVAPSGAADNVRGYGLRA